MKNQNFAEYIKKCYRFKKRMPDYNYKILLF